MLGIELGRHPIDRLSNQLHCLSNSKIAAGSKHSIRRFNRKLVSLSMLILNSPRLFLRYFEIVCIFEIHQFHNKNIQVHMIIHTNVVCVHSCKSNFQYQYLK